MCDPRHIWVGSPDDVRYGVDARNSIAARNDSQYWDEAEGIVRVDRARWLEAQRFEHDGWVKHWRGLTSDRPLDHYKLLGGYKSVPQDLGDVGEFGCGPFTQLKSIVEFGVCQFKSATLIDPLIDEYVKLPNCSYGDGLLLGRPVTTVNCQAEEFAGRDCFDTVVCINVLEHVQDAVVVLDRLFESLRVGGLVIIGERTYDGFDCGSVFDVGHPIRVKSAVVDRFRQRFDVVFGSGGYFIGRRVR